MVNIDGKVFRTSGAVAERMVVIADTRSGKSTIVNNVVQPIESVVAVDPKFEAAVEVWHRENGYFVTSDPNDIVRYAKVLYRPPQPVISDRGAKAWNDPSRPGWQWTVALRAIFWRQDTVVRFLEAIELLPSQGCHPEAKKLVTQGGALNIAGIFETQAPIYVTPLAFSQSEHCVAMRIVHDEYLKYIRTHRGVDVSILPTLPDYGWAWHTKPDQHWVEFEPVPAPSQSGDFGAVENSSLSDSETPDAQREIEHSGHLTESPDAEDGSAV